MITGMLTSIVNKDKSRGVVLQKYFSLYVDNHGNRWDAKTGYASTEYAVEGLQVDSGAVWKLNIGSIIKEEDMVVSNGQYKDLYWCILWGEHEMSPQVSDASDSRVQIVSAFILKEMIDEAKSLTDADLDRLGMAAIDEVLKSGTLKYDDRVDQFFIDSQKVLDRAGIDKQKRSRYG